MDEPLAIQPRRITKVVDLITDPDPRFLSIVDHGANQTPWRYVKADSVPAGLTKLDPMHKTKVSKDASNMDATKIHKLIFKKGDAFPDESSVTEFMKAQGFENVSVQASETAFTVPGVDESAFNTIKSIPYTANGDVTMFVGDLKDKTEEQKSASTADPVVTPVENVEVAPKRNAQKAATEAKVQYIKFDGESAGKENLKKVDYYLTYYSDGTTIAGVLEDSKDGIPVGFFDISDLFRKALMNLILLGRTSEIPALTAEYGEIIVRLATITGSIQKADELTTAVNTLFSTKEAMNKSESTETPPVGSAPVTPATPAPTPEQKSDAPPITPATTPQPPATPDATDFAAIVQRGVEAAIAPLKEELTKATTRITQIESLRQVQKSADVEDTTPPTPDKKPPVEPDRFQRSAIGRR